MDAAFYSTAAQVLAILLLALLFEMRVFGYPHLGRPEFSTTWFLGCALVIGEFLAFFGMAQDIHSDILKVVLLLLVTGGFAFIFGFAVGVGEGAAEVAQSKRGDDAD